MQDAGCPRSADLGLCPAYEICLDNANHDHAYSCCLILRFCCAWKISRGYLTALPPSVSLALRNQSTPPLAGTTSQDHSGIDSSSCHRPWLPALVLYLSSITRFACNLRDMQSAVKPGWLEIPGQVGLCESEKWHELWRLSYPARSCTWRRGQKPQQSGQLP